MNRPSSIRGSLHGLPKTATIRDQPRSCDNGTVLNQRDPWRHAPVFVLAPARSCTSVVTAIIGGHPDLYGFPELNLFTAEDVQHLMAGACQGDSPYLLSGLHRAVAQLNYRIQTPEAIDAAHSWLSARRSWNVFDLFDHFLELIAPATGIEKSPETAAESKHLDRLAAFYPRARFIHLTRHPITTIRSMQKHWARPGLLTDAAMPQFCAGTWYFDHRRIAAFCDRLPHERTVRLRSEDVLNRPSETLPGLARWLGVRTDNQSIDEMLNVRKSPYAAIGSDNAPGGNDPEFLKDPTPHPIEHPTSLVLPREWQIDPWCHLAIAMLATHLGYPHSPSDDCASLEDSS